MTNFNEICYSTVIEFLTLENAELQQIYSQKMVVYGEDVSSSLYYKQPVMKLDKQRSQYL